MPIGSICVQAGFWVLDWRVLKLAGACSVAVLIEGAEGMIIVEGSAWEWSAMDHMS